MDAQRLESLLGGYADLRIAVVGDFSLDRYLEIDPAKSETSIETGKEVYNVARVRSQPGAAGTILNNLTALGVGAVYPVGFYGLDGEGYELQQALRRMDGIYPDYFLETPQRRTFTYVKPLWMAPGTPPVELNRLDFKNWTPTPEELQSRLVHAVDRLSQFVDALVLLDQVDQPETGVITTHLLKSIAEIQHRRPNLVVVADSRRGLKNYPPLIFKMNHKELGRLLGKELTGDLQKIRQAAQALAAQNQKAVFVTLEDQGILGALPDGSSNHQPAWPTRGPIDVVGAGDAVTANLAAALASGASLEESLTLANAAASVVVHQIGTTGVARPEDLKSRFA